MSNDFTPGTKKRPWLVIGIAVLLIGGGVFAFTFKSGPEKPKARKAPDTITIVLPPPPLPPPPPPKPEPPKPEEVKQEMVQQEKVEEDTPPPPAPAPPDEPSPELATNLTGPGNDNFGLAKGSGRGGNGTGSGTIGGGRRGGKYDSYAAQVQSSLRSALGRDPKTRNASFSGTFRIWVDATGRITRATGSDGNANAALTGLQLAGAPPSDMPMPINLRISATKPAAASR